MADSPNLMLPFLEAAQAQKHVTHNEALRALDAIVMLSVLDRDLPAPPGATSDGDRYLVAGGATGAWAAQDGRIAAWQDGAWAFYVPKPGWLAWIADEATLAVFTGSAWVGPSVQNVAAIGIGTTADAVNRLTVAAEALLFTHAGNGVQTKLNKNAAGDTASLLFQTGFSARAEFGTTGDDDFHVKVSPDGSTFHEAFIVDRNSGETRFEQPVALKQYPVTALPSAAAGSARLIHVYDEAGGPTVAYSDGGTWRRIYDNAAVS